MSASPSLPAIDNRPLVGKEVNIRIAVTPGTVTLLAAPLTVAASSLIGCLLLQTFGLPLCLKEMVAAGIINTLGGMIGMLPLLFLMNRGAAAIAQAGILAIALRCGIILMGLLMAMAPAWALDRMPVVYWTLGNYFPMLMVETALIAWLCQKSRH